MDYKELDVWLQARNLVKTVYVLTKTFPKEEQYGLTSQIRRCVVSVSSNIAEGCGRQSNKETVHFLHISRGSLYELETQIILANDLEYITSDINAILNEVERVKKLLNGFINYQKRV
ncbi:four helix bundle protein [Cellulophaga tyrosinoxydans]|uniref:Four helix bundle protein n=1 Tax=Cellulophaga tyrosinoxydans TaxID=504486 RepID=A0A1W1YA76_9FLAO|nr:four helix bundle protein [Cellulophaga tyrosinoxydans]SMC33014.1 four helix bundle protein [Cellulophaga tyrosinoxydans]